MTVSPERKVNISVPTKVSEPVSYTHLDVYKRQEKQLAAYTGDDSEEGRLKRQELQTSLKEARSDLADTQYDQRMDDTKKLLDELYTEYETILNQRLDSMEQLVTDVISGVTQEAGQIRDTISSEAAKAGYTLTQAMQTIWGNDGAVGTALGAIQASLEAIYVYKRQ